MNYKSILFFIIANCYLSTGILSQSSESNMDFEIWDLNDLTADLWHDTLIVENRTGLFPPKWHYRPDFIHEGSGLGRTTDATTGDYAVALSGFYQYQVIRIISGESAANPGWPIDTRPEKLIGDYKVVLLGTRCDSLRGYVDVFLTKHNPLKNKRDTIGEGSITLFETSNSYHQFDLDIKYINEFEQPDSVIIVLAKERFGFDLPPSCLECSHVFFDNLHFDTTVSSDEQDIRKMDAKFFPNPTSQNVYLKTNCIDCKFNVSVISSVGQLINTYNGLYDGARINLGKGVFILKIEDNQTKDFTFQQVVGY